MYTRVSSVVQQAWIAALLAFVIGLIVGWLLLGWVLFPVQYVGNADPTDLNNRARADWVAMAADSYSLNKNTQQLRERLRGFDNATLTEIIREQVNARNQAGDARGAANLQALASAYGLNLAGPAAPTPRPTPVASGGALGSFGPVLLLIIILFVALALGLFVYTRFRPQFARAVSRRSTVREAGYENMPTMAPSPAPAISNPMMAPPTAATMPTPAPAMRSAPPPRAAPPAVGKTLGTFAATYKFGDDNYDTAFTLETGRNEFLGECGMGISETVGDGKPDKVTAFDLWLFDKTDVRTVTDILMSEYAYNDQTLRAKLAPKGELTLAEKGKRLVLETATLRVDAEIVDLVYASTPGLPPNSHFQKLIVELVPVQK